MTLHEEYAKALFLLTEELGTSEQALSDISICREALLENPSYRGIADSPALPVSEKLALIREAFASVREEVRNLIMILCEQHSVSLLPAVAKAYRMLYNEARGIIEAEIISAAALSEAQMEKTRSKLRSLTGKEILLKNTIDKTLIGGAQLRYSGIQLDGSLRARLSDIESRLKSSII